MSGSEFEVPPWTAEHELRIEEENQAGAERSERATEINCRGCDPEYLKRWYDDQPIEVKIRIQKKNIFDCKLMGFGHGVRHFEAKLAALMEEKNRENQRTTQRTSGGVIEGARRV